MDWNSSTLSFLALSPLEIRILKCLSESKNLQTLSEDLKIARTSVAFTLKSLSKKDLIKISKFGKRFQYIAITPEQVAQKMQIVIDEIYAGSKNRKGARVKTSKESEFVVHVGMKEIIPMYKRIFSLNKLERWKAIQPNKAWMSMHQKLSKAELLEINNAIRENKIIVDAVIQDNAYSLYKTFFNKDPLALGSIVESFTNRIADYSFVESKFFDYPAEIWLFEKTFCIINWQEEVAIEITNKDIMGFIKDMYEIVKQTGRKIDHNQVMRELLEQS